MTDSLKQAFDMAAKLPKDRQEAIAQLLLEELASEERWAESFASSQDQLAALAQEALEEFRRGETRPFEQDRRHAQQHNARR